MGIESKWDGIITFYPPIPAVELQGSPYDLTVGSLRDFAFVTESEDVGSFEDGWEVRRTRKTVTGLKATYQENFRGYNILEQIQSLLNFLAIRDLGPFQCPGYIEKLTENGDLSRFYIRDSVVTEVPATITWPGFED